MKATNFGWTEGTEVASVSVLNVRQAKRDKYTTYEVGSSIRETQGVAAIDAMRESTICRAGRRAASAKP